MFFHTYKNGAASHQTPDAVVTWGGLLALHVKLLLLAVKITFFEHDLYSTSWQETHTSGLILSSCCVFIFFYFYRQAFDL